MDELLDLIVSILQQIEQNIDELDDEEYSEIANFLNQATQLIAENQNEQRPPNQPPPPVTPSLPIEAPPPMGTELLWILAGGREDAFVNYLRTFPDPTFNSLLQNPAQLQQVIDDLARRYPEGIHLEEDGIPHAPLMSSNIYGFRYDPKSGRLLVRFNSGSVYGYDNVPRGVFNIFQQGAVPARTNGQNRFGRWWQGKIPSLGAAFYQMIRQGNYPYQRLN